MQTLFPESFVRGIQRLRIVARHVVPGGDPGEHSSRHAGSGMDFRDFRPYVAGDDLRRVDWNVYRRSHRLFVRRFDEPRRLSVYILLDVSDSMFFEDPPRADAARQAAAAMAAASMHQHDRVVVYPFGRALQSPLRVTPRAGLPPFLAALGDLGPSGTTDLAAVLQRFAQLHLRAGLLVLVSDFFEPQGVDAVLTALAGQRHRLLLIQLVRASDVRPELRGDLELVDCEDGATLRMTTTEAALEDYRRAYDVFQAKLHSLAIRRRAPLFRIDADQPVLPQLDRLFIGGVLRL
jgi:uncharacterized protein (DUF58 family)